MLVEPIPGRLGNGLYSNALKDSTNWGGHERASSIAAVIYLDDTARLNELVRAHREYLGENVSPKTMDYEPTNWHADPNNKAGVNRIGSIIQGKNVSGVMPEDWRRNSEFQWPPDPGVYQWEGVQGYVVASAILQRRSLVPFNSADNAVVRVMNMLYGNGEAATNSPVFTNPPVGDDTWIPWLVNSFSGSAYPTTIPTQAGKGMGYTDWTHP